MNEAEAVFHEIIDSGCSPTTFTFNAVIPAHVKANKRENALQVHNPLKRFGCLPDLITYNFLIESHCRDDKVDHALKLLDQMASKGVQPNSSSGFRIRNFCLRKEGFLNREYGPTRDYGIDISRGAIDIATVLITPNSLQSFM